MFSRLLGPPAKAADEFIAKLSMGNIRAAYDSVDPGLKNSMTFEEFESSVKRNRLDQIEIVKWRSTNVTPPTARCTGVANLKDGSTAEVEAVLIESDAWRVSEFSLNGHFLHSVQQPLTVGPATASALAMKTLIQWDRAIKSKDFTNFYANVAEVWKRQTTPDELKQAFSSFIELESDIAGIADTEPVFVKGPEVSEGKLEMTGYYPTTPMKVHFELSYIMESGEWRLARINVRMAAD